MAQLLTTFDARADCTDVVAMSKLTTSVVQTSQQIEEYARDFCNQYSSNKSNTFALQASASYKVLSASLGISSQSIDQVASSYCDATQHSNRKNDSYRQYVESIAPGAYDSYNTCIALQADNVIVSPQKNTLLPKELTISVSYASQSGNANFHMINWSASSGVSCAWSVGNAPSIKLSPGSTNVLKCNRTDDSKKSSVTVFATTRAHSDVSFLWSAYTNQLPTDALAILNQQVSEAVRVNNLLTQSIASAVVPFAAGSCPAGWTEYVPAYGRFIRGIDRPGTTDAGGVRAIANIQEDDFKAHDHTRPGAVYDAHGPKGGSCKNGSDLGYDFDGDAGVPDPHTGARAAIGLMA